MSLAVRAGVLSATTAAVPVSFSLLPREMEKTLSYQGGGITTLVGLTAFIALLISPASSALSLRLGRRWPLAVAAVAGPAALVYAAWWGSSHSLGISAALAGLAFGAVRALVRPIVADAYPSDEWPRAFAAVRAGEFYGAAVVAAIAATVSVIGNYQWRAVLFWVGVAALASALVSLTISDPAVGGLEKDAIREAAEAEPVELRPVSAIESFTRTLSVPSVNAVLGLYALAAAAASPLIGVYDRFLLSHFATSQGGRLAVLVFIAVNAGLAARRFAVTDRGNRSPQDDLSLLLGRTALGLILAVLLPGLFLSVFAATIGINAVARAGVVLDLVLFSAVRERLRTTAAGLSGAAVFVGLFVGGGLAQAVESRFGAGWAIVLPALAAVLAAPLARKIRPIVDSDVARVETFLSQEVELARMTAAGDTPPLLECTSIDFSYGQVQVLFGVDFAVRESEMVALLGTNGAGKSTLLRIISGLGFPQSGTVRIDGRDVTFVPPARRIELGVTQVPGGKAVFGPMTVMENLRMFGYAQGRDRTAVDRGIEEAFDTFPRIAERRDQLASTMSGGEQQMLALTKALILQPRLLLIDELSLGLAPKIVGELLQLVRAINQRGTAVVLVEQSVNVALSLVDHAYYMEKGQMKFDGPSEDLLADPEIVKSVYLAGAAKGLAR